MKASRSKLGSQALSLLIRPAIIIPVYNHSVYIGEVISRAQNLGLPVFVVDDGSTDSTGKILGAIEGITVLRHATNQGKGAALLTGFAAALAQQCNWAITLDGDSQHNPEDAGALLQAVKDGERCIVIGKRRGRSASVLGHVREPLEQRARAVKLGPVDGGDGVFCDLPGHEHPAPMPDERHFSVARILIGDLGK